MSLVSSQELKAGACVNGKCSCVTVDLMAAAVRVVLRRPGFRLQDMRRTISASRYRGSRWPSKYKHRPDVADSGELFALMVD